MRLTPQTERGRERVDARNEMGEAKITGPDLLAQEQLKAVRARRRVIELQWLLPLWHMGLLTVVVLAVVAMAAFGEHERLVVLAGAAVTAETFIVVASRALASAHGGKSLPPPGAE